MDRDKIIVLDSSTNIQKHAGSFRTDLLAIPGIDAVSFTNCIPTRGASVSGTNNPYYENLHRIKAKNN